MTIIHDTGTIQEPPQTYSNLFNFDFTVQGPPNMFKPLALILTPTTQEMFKFVQCDARTVGKREVHYCSGPNTSAVVQ